MSGFRTREANQECEKIQRFYLLTWFFFWKMNQSDKGKSVTETKNEWQNVSSKGMIWVANEYRDCLHLF